MFNWIICQKKGKWLDFHSTPQSDECIWSNVNFLLTLLLLLMEYNLYFLWIYLFLGKNWIILRNPGFKGHFWLNWISFWLWPLDYGQYWLLIWLLVISDTESLIASNFELVHDFCCWPIAALSFIIKALIWCFKGDLLFVVVVHI